MQVATPKKGYKFVKTSFGKYEEIPEEWEIKKIQDIVMNKRKVLLFTGIRSEYEHIKSVASAIQKNQMLDSHNNYSLQCVAGCNNKI